MLEMICAIPYEIGWSLVGASAMFCVVMAVVLGKIIAKAIRERKEEDEE